MNVSIAGAGLIGRLLGWRLTRAGHQVELFERSVKERPESAAHVAAALLGPISERLDSPADVWHLAEASMLMWPDWLKELGVKHEISGTLVVAHGSDLALLDRFKLSLENSSNERFDYLTGRAIQELEPGLPEHFQRVLYLPTEGWIDNRALLSALEHVCGRIRYSEAVDPDNLDADLVVDCRGTGDPDPELRGVRGEILRVIASEVQLRHPIRLMHPRYKLYVSPRSNDEYVIGATQVESDHKGRVTVRSALELLSAAYSLHSGFGEAEIQEFGVGLRPAFPDNRPRIRWRKSVLQVNGMYRHGYLIAPAIVDSVIREINETCISTSMANT